MIDPTVPFFYLIEAEGTAVDSLFDGAGSYGVRKITIGSASLETDMHATAAADRIAEFLLSGLDVSNVQVDEQFNPAFYGDPTTEQEEFDEMGNLIAYRKTAKADSFCVTIRTVASRAEYEQSLSPSQSDIPTPRVTQ